MTVIGYSPGYYLSTLHVRNVVEDLKFNLYGNRVKSDDSVSRRGSRGDFEAENQDDEGTRTTTTSERLTEGYSGYKAARGSPEYLKKIMNLYKPLHPPLPVTLSSFKKNLKNLAERDEKESSRRFPGSYCNPARRMPQTFRDVSLNYRLQNLIEGELQHGNYSRTSKNVRFCDSDDETEKQEADEKYNEYLADYVYPYLLDGYKYPYTRWLMLKREISRIEREQNREKSRSLSSLNDSLELKNERPRNCFEPAGGLKKYGSMSSLDLPPRKHGYLGPAGGNSAYKYRARPWDYMQLLRKQDYHRSMENLLL